MPSRTTRRLAALAFATLLLGWTWLLVRPNPIPEVVSAVPLDLRFLAAKGLHATAYAALAALGMIWPPSRSARRVVLAGLLLHGVGTEVAQVFVPNRSGRVRDVFIDWAGAGVGVAVVRVFVLQRLNGGPVFPTNPAA